MIFPVPPRILTSVVVVTPGGTLLAEIYDYPTITGGFVKKLFLYYTRRSVINLCFVTRVQLHYQGHEITTDSSFGVFTLKPFLQFLNPWNTMRNMCQESGRYLYRLRTLSTGEL